eukprot:8553788-Pyramimonas_sp.AAC.1
MPSDAKLRPVLVRPPDEEARGMTWSCLEAKPGYSRFRNNREGVWTIQDKPFQTPPRGRILQNIVPRPPQALQDSLEETPTRKRGR